MPIWSYEFDLSTNVSSREHRGHEIAAGHLVYSASTRAGIPTMMAVGAVALPGPKVDEAVASFDPESLLVLKPGMAVRVKVNAGDNNARIEASLKRKILANGWKLDPASKIVVNAEMYRGQTQQVNIVKFGVSGPGSEETVTVTPEVASVLITVNGRFAWVAETGIILGTLVLEKGQTAQDEINRMEKPDVKFFDWVEIPDRILDPVKLQNGLGSTLVTTRGLIPSSEEQSIDPRDPKALIRILRERSPWTKGLCNRYMAVREARATSRRSLWGGDACERRADCPRPVGRMIGFPCRRHGILPAAV